MPTFLPVQGVLQRNQDKDLYQRIPRETYDHDQTKLDECLRLLFLVRSDLYGVRLGVEHTNELLHKQQQMQQRLAKGLNRSLAALALLSSNQFKECPNLVWLNPFSVEKEDRYTPKKWIRDNVRQNTASSSSVHTRVSQGMNRLRSRCQKGGLRRLHLG